MVIGIFERDGDRYAVVGPSWKTINADNAGARLVDALPLSEAIRGMQFLTVRRSPISNYEKKKIVLSARAYYWKEFLIEYRDLFNDRQLRTVSSWFEMYGRKYGLLRDLREDGIC